MSATEHLPTHWIGLQPTALQKTAVLLIGTVAVIVAGIQPLVLGGLYEAKRLTIQQVGVAGSVELLALGVSLTIAAAFLPTRRLQWVSILASLAMAATNFANLYCSGVEAIACRGAAGIAEGVMVWLAISMVTRADRPEHWTAIFLTVQTAAQFGCSLLISFAIAPRFGINGSLMLMACCAVTAALAAFLIPSEFQPLPKQENVSPFSLSGRAYAGLLSIFMYFAFVVGVWVYIEPIGMQAGMTHEEASLAVSVSLIAQMIGGVAMTLLGRRLTYFRAIILCAAMNLVLLALLATAPAPMLFFAIVAVHGFLWLFVMPFQVLQMIDIDATRRAALFVSSITIMGMSAGPYIVSWFVSDQDVRGALAVGAACLLLSAGVVIALHGRGSTAVVTA